MCCYFTLFFCIKGTKAEQRIISGASYHPPVEDWKHSYWQTQNESENSNQTVCKLGRQQGPRTSYPETEDEINRHIIKNDYK